MQNRMSKEQMELVRPESIVMEGDLVLSTVASILPQVEKIIKCCAANCEVNLQKVGRSDSAGLSLLLHLVRKARTQYGKTFQFINIPSQMLKLACFTGVDTILFSKKIHPATLPIVEER